MGDDHALTEHSPLVEHLDRSAAEAAQRLLDLPDRLRRVGVDPGVELFGKCHRGLERTCGAVEEVLEPDPRADPAVGGIAVRREQRPVRLDRLEVVVALGVGDVRHERGADPELGRRGGRPFHVAPHVHHRRRAREQALGVAVHRRDLARSRASTRGPRDPRTRGASPTATWIRRCRAAARSGDDSCATRARPRDRWHPPPPPPAIAGRHRAPRWDRPRRWCRHRSTPSPGRRARGCPTSAARFHCGSAWSRRQPRNSSTVCQSSDAQFTERSHGRSGSHASAKALQ